MLFEIRVNQGTIDMLCEVLRRSQEELARNIRVWNGVMRICYGDTGDSPEAMRDIEMFNKRQGVLQKLAEKASEDFKKSLKPDDLKLWEELSLKTRGLAELDKDGEEKIGHLIVTHAASWQRKKDE